MKKVTRANIYFVILLLIEIIGPDGIRENIYRLQQMKYS